MKKLFALTIFLIGFVYAQTIVISPESIVVNPKPSFDVEVFVDKDSTGNNTPAYAIGEQISISVRVSEAAYVYLFNVRSNGEVVQILPNRYDDDGRNNYLRAGETKVFPPRNARYAYTVDAPRGLDKVIAVASKSELNTSQLADFTADPSFATSNIGESGFANALSIVVTPLPQTNWVTDTALFYVGERATTPAFGNLDISSTPSGARAYVDNAFVGYTPVRFGTRPGSHNIRIELDGYQTYTESVNLRAGQALSVSASLGQVQRTGSVSFTSTPVNADVYVNGQFVGTTPTAALTYSTGSYQARFSAVGYEDVFVDFTVSANTDQTVRGQLRAQEGSLSIRANVGGARVFIDGQERGTIANGTGRLTVNNLSSGEHEVVVVAPGFVTFVDTIRIRSGETTEVRVQQSRY